MTDRIEPTDEETDAELDADELAEISGGDGSDFAALPPEINSEHPFG